MLSQGASSFSWKAMRVALRGLLGAVLAAAIAAAGVTGAAFAQEPDIQAILEAIDQQSNFTDTDFQSVATIIVQDPEKGTEKYVVTQFRRDREGKFLLLIQEPAVQRGQGYLMDEENLWFYDPESRKFSHTSLKESFEGTDARNSDFAASRLAEDYRPVGYESGVLAGFQVHIIDLEAVHSEVTDPYLRIWVEKENNLLLKVESYSLTKRLMRTAYFSNYEKRGSYVVATTMLFVDELVAGSRTLVTLSDISFEALPDSVFTKAFVERANR